MVKISIITVVYNGAAHLDACMASVLGQSYPHIEYIVVDGASTDGSLAIAQRYSGRLAALVSEPDFGMYDALNKGIALATGDVIGILNADDLLADDGVIARVAAAFEDEQVQALHGDLNYVAADDTGRVVRKWRAKQASKSDLASGWMPAHPTFYLRRALFERFGGYSLAYGSAGDYELMLRVLYQHSVASYYLPILMVLMRTGGMSNGGFEQRYRAMLTDYKALKTNGVPMPMLVLLLKKIRKVKQYF